MSVRSLLAAGVAILLFASAAQAEPKSPFKAEKLDPPKDSELIAAERSKYALILSGKENAKDHKALIEKYVTWNLYHLTHSKVQRDTVTIKKVERPALAALMDEILYSIEKDGGDTFQMLPNPGNKPDPALNPMAFKTWQNKVENVNIIAGIMMGTAEKPGPLRQLMTNDLIVRVNAMRIYHRLAECYCAAVLPDLEAAVKNGVESNAVKHWALKGLGELFAKQAADPALLKAEDVTRCAYLIAEFIQYHSKLSAEKLSRMTEEEKDAVSFVRRFAILALGHTRLSVIEIKGMDTIIPAELYLPIMKAEKGVVLPEPMLRERVEAAHALILMQPPTPKGYQPEYVAYEVATFVSYLGGQANGDPQRQPSGDPNRTKEQWLYFGRYLSEPFKVGQVGGAVNNMQFGNSQYCQDLVGKMWPVLVHLDTNQTPKSVTNLDDWLKAKEPPNKKLLAGK